MKKKLKSTLIFPKFQYSGTIDWKIYLFVLLAAAPFESEHK